MNIQELESKLSELDNNSKQYGKWERTLSKRLNQGSIPTTIFSLISRAPINWDNLWITNLINRATLGDTTEENMKVVVDCALKTKVIESYNKGDNTTDIVMNDGSELKFIPLTDFWPSLAENRPELLTMNRGGHCHLNSYYLSQFFDMEHNVVSGYCSSYSDSKKFSHTWIEFEGKKNNWVIDYNINAVVLKDAYYKLYNPTDTVAISKDQLREDAMLIKNSGFNNRDIRMYLFWPNDVREIAKTEIVTMQSDNENCM